MDCPKKQRQGGTRDNTEIYIGYTREELVHMLQCIDKRLGVSLCSNFEYKFKYLHYNPS